MGLVSFANTIQRMQVGICSMIWCERSSDFRKKNLALSCTGQGSSLSFRRSTIVAQRWMDNWFVHALNPIDESDIGADETHGTAGRRVPGPSEGSRVTDGRTS